MMASNDELHSLICLLQFMDLSPETALTMLTAVPLEVARYHILAVFKYKAHPNCQSNIYRSVRKIQQ